jgi:hypothetical protein
MTKINNFDVLKEMANRDNGNKVNPKLAMFPASNVSSVRSGKKGWGKVIIAVDNETINNFILSQGRSIICLFAYDPVEFKKIRAELEAQDE